jgi:hypothetical protein
VRNPLPGASAVSDPPVSGIPSRREPGNSSNCEEPNSKRYHGYFRSVCGTGRFRRTLHAAGLAASSERSGKNKSKPGRPSHIDGARGVDCGPTGGLADGEEAAHALDPTRRADVAQRRDVR